MSSGFDKIAGEFFRFAQKRATRTQARPQTPKGFGAGSEHLSYILQRKQTRAAFERSSNFCSRKCGGRGDYRGVGGYKGLNVLILAPESPFSAAAAPCRVRRRPCFPNVNRCAAILARWSGRFEPLHVRAAARSSRCTFEPLAIRVNVRPHVASLKRLTPTEKIGGKASPQSQSEWG